MSEDKSLVDVAFVVVVVVVVVRDDDDLLLVLLYDPVASAMPLSMVVMRKAIIEKMFSILDRTKAQYDLLNA